VLVVGWEVPVGAQPSFLFGARLGADVETAAERFAGLEDPDAIADALGATWHHRSVR
jgi:hypothetical protein